MYMDALSHHDPSRLPLAAHVRFTENGAQVPLGEALWVTFTKPLGYRHDFADTAKRAGGRLHHADGERLSRIT